MDRSYLCRGTTYGNHGHPLNARYSSGLPFEIAVGLLTGLLSGVCLIQAFVHFAIKNKRQSTIFSRSANAGSRCSVSWICKIKRLIAITPVLQIGGAKQ